MVRALHVFRLVCLVVCVRAFFFRFFFCSSFFAMQHIDGSAEKANQAPWKPFTGARVEQFELLGAAQEQVGWCCMTSRWEPAKAQVPRFVFVEILGKG